MQVAKVLVIDDEQTYLDLITETLKEKNYKILQALDGKMGNMVAQRFLPDIIITDWEMPEMDGIETLKQLKNNELTKDIPVIMCTGIMTSSENLDTALNAGAVDFIRKPVDSLELIARINSALNLSDSIKKIKAQNTNLIQKKEEILEQNKRLLDLNATKDKFFSIIAHDLRNPFSNILGFSELLIHNLQTKDSGKIEMFAKTIYDSAQSANRLLGNLLEWAISQIGKTAFNPGYQSLKESLENIIEITAGLWKPKKIAVSYMLNDVELVYADKDLLNSVLLNLITNAIKYTHKNGTVRVEASLYDHHVLISVNDDGVGIEPSKLDKLFKISEKTSSPGTENEKGTGLGLILCKEFIEMHQGEIGVESDFGKGSRFWFTLPIQLIVKE